MNAPSTRDSSSLRFAGLDALRGFAILTMVLSGVIPDKILPAWMYHCQVPPPDHKFNPNIPGITWVDLVFPFFLFAMGAAFPFALQRRMEKGMTQAQASLVILKRGALLFAFAIYQQHISPWGMKTDPAWLRWVYALTGFALLFPMLMRLPDTLRPQWHWAIRAVGWGGAAILLSQLRYSDGTGFSIYRSNIILMLLTVSAVFGSFAWLLTRDNVLLRLGILGILLAHRLTGDLSGWAKWLNELVSIPKIWHLTYVHYLFIVIPGTIAGDMMLAWMRDRKQAADFGKWASPRFALLVALMVTFVVVNLVGLKARLSNLTLALDCALVAVGGLLVRDAESRTERFLQALYWWGAYWLLLGMAFEPYEGGIKKDPNTLSYFFVTSGLAIFTVVAFTIVLDVWQVRVGSQLLIGSGQNPMIAYVGMGNLIHPLFALSGLGDKFDRLFPGPWLGTLRGVLLTLLLAWVVSLFTRARIYWRT
ncbi:MAG: DUF5009 domain-containing protein [Candidatus Sumerlaea chitinivorans]|uniref:DUF5009 domain-containing protein n=1 Tax=Sumerlaea chitinivorans TaxID=2250252 RepID=A0A2Z4Y4U4_SUMC1|nr:hypothetical protein BRCON_1383 [Candidatus Sumerlaea chitinivorans]MCX7964180.1 DUF5009 domain-containing protein [Candidatus Sumerlaea chitinivorans]